MSTTSMAAILPPSISPVLQFSQLNNGAGSHTSLQFKASNFNEIVAFGESKLVNFSTAKGKSLRIYNEATGAELYDVRYFSYSSVKEYQCVNPDELRVIYMEMDDGVAKVY